MDRFRKYGNPPFNAVLVHGGPGAIGEMKPVAMKLSECFGTLESLHRAQTIDGQISEQYESIMYFGDSRPVVVGFSWGAWLSLIFAALNPGRVRKLILIGCGPLEDHHANAIYETRINRLPARQRREFSTLLAGIANNTIGDRKAAFENLSALVSLSDSYDSVREYNNKIEIDPDVFISVWAEASELRRKGRLVQYLSKITCPVIAIHGDYDPHPAEGILEPLQKSLCNFQFEFLKKCGHKPWIERYAHDRFYEVLLNHILRDCLNFNF